MINRFSQASDSLLRRKGRRRPTATDGGSAPDGRRSISGNCRRRGRRGRRLRLLRLSRAPPARRPLALSSSPITSIDSRPL